MKKSKSSEQLQIKNTYKDEPEIMNSARSDSETSVEDWRQRIKVFGIDSSMYDDPSEDNCESLSMLDNNKFKQRNIKIFDTIEPKSQAKITETPYSNLDVDDKFKITFAQKMSSKKIDLDMNPPTPKFSDLKLE